MILALQGVIAELKVKGDPRAAEVQCEEEDDDSDMVSGDGGSGAEEKPQPSGKEKVCPSVSVLCIASSGEMQVINSGR
ncbi:UNVERIFIED_CONTAM: hypothetical protein K2H54_001907 [Gekko kuhli]